MENRVRRGVRGLATGIFASLLMACMLSVVSPMAIGEEAVATDGKTIQPRSSSSILGSDVEELKFGDNLLLAGESLTDSSSSSNGQKLQVSGLLFGFGNTLKTNYESEYAFMAGNYVEINNLVRRDLFVAGNNVIIGADAEIKGSVYGAGSSVKLETNVSGDVSIAAATVKIGDVTIEGNLNLDVDKVIFENGAEVKGVITYNDQADINLNNVTYGRVETYEDTEYTLTTAQILTSKFFSIIALIIAMIIILALFPRLYQRMSTHFENTSSVAKEFIIGVGILIGLPIVGIILMMTVVGIPLTLVLLALYAVIIYLSQGFAGLWLGHMVTKTLIKAETNKYIEAAIGIILLGLMSLVPYLGTVTGVVGLVFGIGLIVHNLGIGERMETVKKSNKPKRK